MKEEPYDKLNRKAMIALMLFLVVLPANPASAGPFQEMGGNPFGRILMRDTDGSWMARTFVFSDENYNICIDEKAIHYAMFNTTDVTDYATRGYVIVNKVYMQYKPESELKKEAIARLQKIKANAKYPGQHKYLHPELLEFHTFRMEVNMQTKKISLTNEAYIDQNGQLLAYERDLSKHNTFQLNDGSYWAKVAANIIELLKKAKDYRKDADK